MISFNYQEALSVDSKKTNRKDEENPKQKLIAYQKDFGNTIKAWGTFNFLMSVVSSFSNLKVYDYSLFSFCEIPFSCEFLHSSFSCEKRLNFLFHEEKDSNSVMKLKTIFLKDYKTVISTFSTILSSISTFNIVKNSIFLLDGKEILRGGSYVRSNRYGYNSTLYSTLSFINTSLVIFKATIYSSLLIFNNITAPVVYRISINKVKNDEEKERRIEAEKLLEEERIAENNRLILEKKQKKEEDRKKAKEEKLKYEQEMNLDLEDPSKDNG